MNLVRRILPFFFAILLFILVSNRPVLAHHQAVLGVSTSSALPQLPPTAEGPGLILPDSPFFFLDQLKQNVRLALAFTPEERAKIRAQIAGERLAELRFMLARNNRSAAAVALAGVSENIRASATELSQAQFRGRDVKKLAKELNEGIKAKQKVLDSFEKNSAGAIKIQAEQAQEDIFESKVEVEDSLPAADLENEIRDDLARKIERKVALASDSARLLRRDLTELSKEASESARKSLKRREEALKKAIEKADETDRKVQEKLLGDEKKKQQVLFEAQRKATAQAQDALIRAQTAATEFKKAQQVVNEIRSGSNPSQTTVQTTSGSSGSGSGSNEREKSESGGGSGKH